MTDVLVDAYYDLCQEAIGIMTKVDFEATIDERAYKRFRAEYNIYKPRSPGLK
jgi:hypothetical protein